MLNQWFAQRILTKNVPWEREKWQQEALVITLLKKTLKMCRQKMHIEIIFGYSTTQKLHFLSKSVSLIFLYFAEGRHGLMCPSSYSYQYKIMQSIAVLALVPTQIWDFLDISLFPKILSLKLFGNSWGNSYTKFAILDINFRFTYG